MRVFKSLLMILPLTACTTIHFENGKQLQTKNSTSSEKWHHNFAYGLYEHSKPVDLNKECDGKNWNKVTTELSFINGLAASVVNNLGPIWYPKTVTIECERKSD